MKIRELLENLSSSEYVEIIINPISYGAYSVNELLKKEDLQLYKEKENVLDMKIKQGSIGVYIGKADETIAEDSECRKDMILSELEIPYITIEVEDL